VIPTVVGITSSLSSGFGADRAAPPTLARPACGSDVADGPLRASLRGQEMSRRAAPTVNPAKKKKAPRAEQVARDASGERTPQSL
jgi:hypothetical protein